MICLLHFEERVGSIYLMDNVGNTQYEVTNPAVVFDKNTFVVFKIGNKETVMAYYEESVEKCNRAGISLFDNWVVMDLPKDAVLLDNILHCSGYMKFFLKESNITIN